MYWKELEKMTQYDVLDIFTCNIKYSYADTDVHC